MMKLVVNLFMPALILENVLGNPALSEGRLVFVSIALGAGFVCLATTLGYLLGPIAGLRQGSGRRTFAVSGGIQNYGYLAIPVLAAVFGDSANLGILFVHNLGVEIAMWTVGVFLLAGSRNTPGWRIVVNGPLLAVVVGLVANAFDLGPMLPGFVRETMRMLGGCAIPIGILLCGLTIGDVARGWRPNLRVSLIAIGVRLAIVPAIMISVLALATIPDPLARVVVVQAAMPAGIFPIVMARHFGGHPETAIHVVLSTTLVSFVTIPLLVSWAASFLGLL